MQLTITRNNSTHRIDTFHSKRRKKKSLTKKKIKLDRRWYARIS